MQTKLITKTYHDLVFIFDVLKADISDLLLLFHLIWQPVAENFEHKGVCATRSLLLLLRVVVSHLLLLLLPTAAYDLVAGGAPSLRCYVR